MSALRLNKGNKGEALNVQKTDEIIQTCVTCSRASHATEVTALAI